MDGTPLPDNWIACLRQLEEGWVELLLAHLIAEEAADLERPHLVVFEHVDTGFVTYQGPYPNALSALLAGQAERDATRENDGDEVSYKIARLFTTQVPATRSEA